MGSFSRVLRRLGATHAGSFLFVAQETADSPVPVTHVRITLEPSDTYKVEFLRVRSHGPAHATTVLADFDGVYADMLHSIIETNTGLHLSL